MNFQPYGNSPLRTFNKMVFLLLFFAILAVLHFGFSTIWQFSIFFTQKDFHHFEFSTKKFSPKWLFSNFFSPFWQFFNLDFHLNTFLHKSFHLFFHPNIFAILAVLHFFSPKFFLHNGFSPFFSPKFFSP